MPDNELDRRLTRLETSHSERWIEHEKRSAEIRDMIQKSFDSMFEEIGVIRRHLMTLDCAAHVKQIDSIEKTCQSNKDNARNHFVLVYGFIAILLGGIITIAVNAWTEHDKEIRPYHVAYAESVSPLTVHNENKK